MCPYKSKDGRQLCEGGEYMVNKGCCYLDIYSMLCSEPEPVDEENNCPICKSNQYSEFDREYLKRYKTCWQCDFELFKQKKLSIEDFEDKESAIFRKI